MDGRSRPYFCGVDQTLNFQQKEALAQGILQVVETIPEGFESFEFHFTGHQVHIYKLAHGIILLVLTRSDLVHADYLKTIKDLKAALQEDIANAIATFRLIAGNITLSGMNNRKPDSPPSSPVDSGSVKSSKSFLSYTQPTATNPANHMADSVTSSAPSTDGSGSATSLKDVLAALNHLSQFTTQYLGTHVIVNYWKSTRPNSDWLNQLQIDRSAQFSCTGPPQILHQPLSLQQHQSIREWVAAFIQRCTQVIRDFPAMVEQQALTLDQKALLLELEQH